MLTNIYIKNFALIEEINIDFREGFNVLSGETGSGKSIIINAISLLKGERVNKDFMGKFGDFSIVEGSFYIEESQIFLFEEKGIDIEDNLLIVTRRFSKNSSTVRINNRIVTLSLLQAISDSLIDIHGQHSQLIALNKSNYLGILDSFNKIETNKLKTQIKSNLKEIDRLKGLSKELNITDEELLREKDLLLYQMEEIEDFNFEDYREEELNQEYKKLSNTVTIQTNIMAIQTIIRGGSYSKKSLKEDISNIESLIGDIVEFDDELKVFEEEIINLKDLVDDFNRSLESYYYSVSVNESRIRTIEDIFSSFQNLKRKYGRDQEEILQFYDKIKSRYQLLDNIEEKRREIKKDLAGLSKKNLDLAEELTGIRKTVAKEFEGQMIAELLEMNIKNIEFYIDFLSLEEVGENGKDQIDFLISTNKGQDVKSLSQVASGGEISRFMLALKAILADYDNVQTIIFDEIDTGISGRTAQIVGEKLLKISKKRQVVVITHLPQIAALADSHYLIEKNTVDNKTLTSMVKIDQEERVHELARLISGVDITDLSISSAREMLDLTRKL